MVSLLLNSKSIDEATEILHDIVVTLQSRTISEKKNQGCIDRLIGKVNTFDTSIFSELLTDEEGISAQFDPTRVPPGRFTEEEFLNLVNFSPFKSWGHKIANTATCTSVDDNNGSRNPYHSEVFLQQILNKYIPVFPLWGSILTANSTVPKCTTQGTIENRFRILKFIGLDGRKNRRLDDFAEELKRQTIEIQRLAAKDSLKSVNKVKRKRNTSTVKENWCKKQKSDFLDNVGAF